MPFSRSRKVCLYFDLALNRIATRSIMNARETGWLCLLHYTANRFKYTIDVTIHPLSYLHCWLTCFTFRYLGSRGKYVWLHAKGPLRAQFGRESADNHKSGKNQNEQRKKNQRPSPKNCVGSPAHHPPTTQHPFHDRAAGSHLAEQHSIFDTRAQHRQNLYEKWVPGVLSPTVCCYRALRAQHRELKSFFCIFQ